MLMNLQFNLFGINKMENPLITICTPIYGVEKYIERCAVSLFEQSYNNIEFIFVDDCSKDNSVSILNRIISRYPKRNISIIRHSVNRGLAAARNTAVEHAHGDFILHVDSDDWLEKKAVEILVNHQLAENADIVVFGATAYYKYKTHHVENKQYDDPKDLCIDILRVNAPTYLWNRLIRRELYIKYNIKTIEGLNMGEDYQVVPILTYYSNKCISINDSLYNYEARNIDSYTHKFSNEKYRQKAKSREAVESFFSDKGQDFIEALRIRDIKASLTDLIQLLNSEKREDEIYNSLIKKIHVNNDIWSCLPLSKRLILYIPTYIGKKIFMKLIKCLKMGGVIQLSIERFFRKKQVESFC